MTERDRILLDKLLADWKAFREEMGAVDLDYVPRSREIPYGFAYWLIRHSGWIVQPGVKP